jgi:hypothetical protein
VPVELQTFSVEGVPQRILDSRHGPPNGGPFSCVCPAATSRPAGCRWGRRCRRR